MQNAEHMYLIVDFIDDEKWQWRGDELTRAVNAARAATMRKYRKRAGSGHDLGRYMAGKIDVNAANEIANAFEVIRRVDRPPDAH